MYIKSPYPDPPPLPDANAHHLLFKRPDQAEWTDYTFHVDPQTGCKKTYRQFLARIQDLATAMSAPIAQGGLGMRGEDGEIVGIMSENCSVSIRCLLLFILSHAITGLHGVGALLSYDHYAVRFDLVIFHSL